MGFWRRISTAMPLLATVMLHLHVKSCPEDQFELPDQICCHFCSEGRFVTKNCTRNKNSVTGVKCSPCSECADGMQMIAPCTSFTDTQCSVKGTESPVIDPTQALPVELLYVIVPVVLILIIAALGYKWCSRRSASREPAEEPVKIMV
ncbi:hypothetical protein KOW79_017254 [Hemibagrus wyckioides]|uniref:TNFR-Cys domain-containing protein n=1 Tax=Hemibagrus wyckioides TaxID=337641 RepID=A0A9D3ND02_9TELE|nr:hypothetical protein KOW79_017254 [Hemibagrus wyckioides]